MSVRWNGKLMVPRTDEYVFYIIADDYAQLFLNHSLLIDTSAVCCIEYRASLVLFGGVYYDIVIDYVELTGSASVQMSYSSSSITKQTIPPSVLFYAMPIVGSPYSVMVVPGAADYPFTIAFGEGTSNATAGQTAQFFIQTKDSVGNNQTIDYENFEPTELLQVIITANGANVVYYGDLIYLGNGLFSCTYLPLYAGSYQLSVRMGDFDIYCGHGESNKCSPFALTVNPGPTVSAVTEAESPYNQTMDYLVEAIAGQLSYFYIQAKDAYGNNRRTGGDAFRALFTLVSNDAVQYKGNIEDNSDGTYTVYYALPIAGEYDVAVSLQDELYIDESIQTCVAASSPFLFSRFYDGISPYIAPSFCSQSHPILTVVHSTFYAPACTYNDGPEQTLAFARTGITNTFTIESRDVFGNLREGDNTTHFAGYGDGKSDYFTVMFSKPEIGYSYYVTSAVNVISSSSTAIGFFRLSFGGKITQDIPSTVTADGLTAALESLFDLSLQVYITKTEIQSPYSVSWTLMFLNMLEVWQSRPPSGPPTGAQLQLISPSNSTDPFFPSLTISKTANRGVYPVSFTLWITGSYTVHITSNGVDILGSPLTTFVSNGALDPTASVAYGQGLTLGLAGEASLIYIQAKDTRRPQVEYIALRGLYPIDGTFFLTFKGERTVPLAYNSSAASVRSALMALYSIGEIYVTLDTFGIPSSAVEQTSFYLASVWTVHFNGTCGGNFNGIPSGRCPESLGEEPLFGVNTDLLNYISTPVNVHAVPPEVLVVTTQRGYGGNNLTSSNNLAAVAVSLTHRTLPVEIGMNAVQRITCEGDYGEFTLQFLGELFFLNSSMSTQVLVELLNSSPKSRQGYYTVNASGSSGMLCSFAGSSVDITFAVPTGAVPIFDVLSVVNLTVAVHPIIYAIDYIATVSSAPGLYSVAYTPTIQGTVCKYFRISLKHFARDLRYLCHHSRR